MIYSVYCVRDVKTSFASPFVDVSDESAKRGFGFAFHHSMNGDSSLMTFSPADFILFKIGEFNNESGELVPCLPAYICSGVDFKEVFNET